MDKFEILRNFALPFYSCNDIQLSTSDVNDVNMNKLNFRQFSEQLLCLDDKRLNRILDDIDLKHKVNEHDPKTEEIVTATEALVNGILQAAGEIDPRFQSRCIYSGSYYDGLKVGSADEFDFVARINSLSKPGVLEAKRSARKRGFVYLVVKDVSLINEFEDFLTSPDDDPCLDKNDVILNVDTFQDHFQDLIFSAINSIDIPDSFIPIEKFDEDTETQPSWRPIRSGPCATLRLSYMCQTTQDVVDLDIDIAPSIAYPEIHYKPIVLEKLESLKDRNSFLDILENICFSTEVMLVPFRFDYTEPSGKSSWHYHYSNTWRVSHSSIEKAVFSLFGKDSVEKKLCRILKILKEIYLQGTEEVEVQSDSRRLKLQEPPSTKLNFCTIEPVTSVSEEYLYCSDTDSDEESESFEGEGNFSSEDNLMVQENENTCELEEHVQDEKCDNFEPNTIINQTEVSRSKTLDQFQLTNDQSVKVIYNRQSEILKQHATASVASPPVNRMNKQLKSSHTQSEVSTDIDQSLECPFNFHIGTQISCEREESYSDVLNSSAKFNMNGNGSLNQKHIGSMEEYRLETACDYGQPRTTIGQIEEEPLKTKDLDQSQLTCDENDEIIYGQKSVSHAQFSTPDVGISPSERKIEEQLSSIPTQSEISNVTEPEMSNILNYDYKRKTPCSNDEKSNEDFESLASSSNIYNESLNHGYLESDKPSGILSDTFKFEQRQSKDNKGHEIYYRDSKPLLKTYMIKMLFLAMKTAYPDQESWEPNQLSVLLKMALCMIYFAHNCKEKGIFNFWFQDLIENRTRKSTCAEVLYCLDQVVMYFSKMIQDNGN